MSLAVFTETPICLVENTDGELKLNPHALQILTSITKPVIVVAIAGLHHTGKSYLVKRLAGSNPFFSPGSTVQSETKGIWMWCVPHSSKLDHVLVLLDTEGLGDVEKRDPKNDSWIFALAVLLSSTFVYNSMNIIDDQALEQMQYLRELTKRIKVKSSPYAAEKEESEEFVGFFPDFVWTVRDFTQELKADGCPITSDQYLENALKLNFSESQWQFLPQDLLKHPRSIEIIDSCCRFEMDDLSRECIRKFFPKRNCFVFDRPTKDKSLLACLQDVPDRQLEPLFRNQIDRFCSYILCSAKSKTLSGGIKINGRRLGKLLETYVRAISRGDVPCLENAVMSLVQTEDPDAGQKAVKHYMEQMALKVDFPTETLQYLLRVHTECEKEALSIFMKDSVKGDLKVQKKLMQILETKKDSFIRQNEELSTKYCQTQLEHLSQSLREAISKGTFSVTGGYNRFKKKREEIINNYYQMPRKGLKADEVLQKFLQSLSVMEDYILQTDQALSAQEKALEVEQIKREAAKKEKKLLKQQQVEMQQKMEAQQTSFEENMNQLKRKMVEDRYKILGEQKMILDSKLKEQKKLMEEGFQMKPAKMNKTIEGLQAKIKDIENKIPFH